MSDQIIELGYIGKVPCLGDFVQENVCQQFSDYWEHWLQAAMAVSKEQLGSFWQERYLTSPVWHFALSPRIVTDKGKMGTLLPSVDAVGRHYPFTVLSDTDEFPISILESGIFSLEYEDAVLEVLDDSVDLYSWRKQVAETLKTLKVDNKRFSYQPSVDGNKRAHAFEFDGVQLSDNVLQDTMHGLLSEKYGEYSIWWTHGSVNTKPTIIITPGLPPVNQFAAMIDGRWQHWEWNYTQVRDSE
ncbi:type VI secretion system-associated protein TagF [Pseudoalteromonas mariniglutinosa]|uniref:type VI secretion system-associated protein TagF n=1 Tax=Pseudoalteromonas mariniglutinosa TaxID=206042 RepID=UPI00384D5921